MPVSSRLWLLRCRFHGLRAHRFVDWAPQIPINIEFIIIVSTCAHTFPRFHQKYRESMVVPAIPKPRQELQDVREASSLQRRQQEETEAKMLQLQQEEVAKQDRTFSSLSLLDRRKNHRCSFPSRWLTKGYECDIIYIYIQCLCIYSDVFIYLCICLFMKLCMYLCYLCCLIGYFIYLFYLCDDLFKTLKEISLKSPGLVLTGLLLVAIKKTPHSQTSRKKNLNN
jgi:hypothetical protein